MLSFLNRTLYFSPHFHDALPKLHFPIMHDIELPLYVFEYGLKNTISSAMKYSTIENEKKGRKIGKGKVK